MSKREDYIHDRLIIWAEWLTQRESSGLGYPLSSAFCKAAGRSASTDTLTPLVGRSLEAEQTHQAVESLRFDTPHLWLTVHCRYVGDPRVPNRRRVPLGVAGACQALLCAPATLHARTKDAKDRISIRLRELQARRQQSIK